MDKYRHLELDDEDQIDTAVAIPGGGKETPRYPWGLRICLTDAEMAKLGMNGLPDVGDTLHFSAFADVTSINASDGEMGKSMRLELQITHILAMEDENTEVPGRD